MAQSKEFVDASHALNDLSHALALLESENASLRGAVDGLCHENTKLRKLSLGLRELSLGLKWCSENYGCENSCPLYDKSEQDHCREERLLRELGVEVE